MGYLVPGRDGPGSGQMGELSARRRRRRHRFHLEIGVWNSFGFWPESVSYERSRLIRRCILCEIAARAFFGKISKYRKNRFPIFPGYGKNRKINFPIFPGLGRMLKTSISNISRIIENVPDLNFQYFQDRNN